MPEPSNDTPSVVTIKVEKYLETTIAGVHEYVLYVNGMEYKKLPLDANVREPDPQKSKPYKDMLQTLKDHPEYFFENNLGISVIASHVEPKANNKFALEFKDGTGILNGGHTQLAILDSQANPNLDKAIIRITVRTKNYTKSRIAEIAAAQNSSTAVKEYSLAEKRGLFAEIKKYIDPNKEKHIIWWEGREVNKGIDPSDLIAILNVFNIFAYSSDYSTTNAQPKESATSKSTVFKRWEKEEFINEYEVIYPLINDILDLYELIQLKFADGSGMTMLSLIRDTEGKGKELVFGTETCTYVIPKQMLFPLLAAYRANIYYDKPKKKIGWYDDNEKLFRKYNKELCTRLKQTYNANGKNVNKISKDPAIWENLYNSIKEHVDKSKVFKSYDI